MSIRVGTLQLLLLPFWFDGRLRNNIDAPYVGTQVVDFDTSKTLHQFDIAILLIAQVLHSRHVRDWVVIQHHSTD